MRRNTVEGNYRTTPHLIMKAFDKLPRDARAALANAVEDWVPQPILTRHRANQRGYQTAADIVTTIAEWDRKELEERESKRRAAIGPYKGNAPDPRHVRLSRRRARR